MTVNDLDELTAALADDLTLLLGAAERATRAELFARLAALGHDGIRPAHLPVFAGLKAGGSRVSALAHQAGMTRQAMSMLVRDVEAAGYIRTEPDPDDGRAVRVALTERGDGFCRDAARCSRDVAAAYASAISAGALQALRETTRALADIPPGTAR